MSFECSHKRSSHILLMCRLPAKTIARFFVFISQVILQFYDVLAISAFVRIAVKVSAIQ